MSGPILSIVNDPPYGTERTYNGLRLAAALTRRDDSDVWVLPTGDAVAAAMANQKLPDGYCHLDRMIGTCAEPLVQRYRLVPFRWPCPPCPQGPRAGRR